MEVRSVPSMLHRNGNVGNDSKLSCNIVDNSAGAYKAFLVIQILNLFILWVSFGSGDIWIHSLSGLLCIISYFMVIKHEVSLGSYVATPFLFFLISGAIRLGVVPFWALICDLNLEITAFNFTRFNMREWIIEGQFILVLGDLLFIFGYTIVRHVMQPDTFFLLSKDVSVIAYVTLFICLPFIAMNLIMGEALVSIGQFFRFFSSYGIIAVLLLMLLSRHSTRKVPWFVICITIVVGLAVALRSYMKQDAMVILMPFAIVFIPYAVQKLKKGVSHRTWIYFFISGLVLAIFLAWLFTLSQIRRTQFTVVSDDKRSFVVLEATEVPLVPAAKLAAASLLPWSEEFREYQKLPRGGMWTFFSRHADQMAAGWVFSEVQVKGTNDGEFLYTGLIGLIPRVFWPSKPEIAQGRTVAVRLGQAKTEGSAMTSTHVGGMAPALYLDAGWIWLLVGMTLSGAIFSFITYLFLPRISRNPFAAIASISLYVQSLRHFESAFDAGISIYAYPLIVFLPLAMLWDKFLEKQ